MPSTLNLNDLSLDTTFPLVAVSKLKTKEQLNVSSVPLAAVSKLKTREQQKSTPHGDVPNGPRSPQSDNRNAPFKVNASTDKEQCLPSSHHSASASTRTSAVPHSVENSKEVVGLVTDERYEMIKEMARKRRLELLVIRLFLPDEEDENFKKVKTQRGIGYVHKDCLVAKFDQEQLTKMENRIEASLKGKSIETNESKRLTAMSAALMAEGGASNEAIGTLVPLTRLAALEDIGIIDALNLTDDEVARLALSF